MCLFANSMPRTARKDITVYKRLRINYNSPQSIVTPYQDMKVRSKIMSTLENDPFKDQINRLMIFTSFFTRTSISINEGIHSYTDRKTAVENLGLFEVLVKSVIPKGSLYIKDKHREEIVSNKLVLENVILEGHGTGEKGKYIFNKILA